MTVTLDDNCATVEFKQIEDRIQDEIRQESGYRIPNRIQFDAKYVSSWGRQGALAFTSRCRGGTLVAGMYRMTMSV